MKNRHRYNQFWGPLEELSWFVLFMIVVVAPVIYIAHFNYNINWDWVLNGLLFMFGWWYLRIVSLSLKLGIKIALFFGSVPLWYSLAANIPDKPWMDALIMTAKLGAINIVAFYVRKIITPWWIAFKSKCETLKFKLYDTVGMFIDDIKYRKK